MPHCSRQVHEMQIHQTAIVSLDGPWAEACLQNKQYDGRDNIIHRRQLPCELDTPTLSVK